MSNLLIFDPADNLIAVLSNEAEEACAFWNAPFKEMLNQGSTFEFMADGLHEDSKHIIAENQVAFLDKDGAFRLFVIKEPERIDGESGPEIHAICEPAMLELNDEIITDVRPFNTTLRDAITRALNGVRWQVGQTSDNFGLNSTNFYYISVTEAIENIVNTWGGEIRDRVEIQGNRIVGRYIDILTMRGTNTGKRWEMDKDILSIRHQVQSYPKTALYGRGASLELEDGDGNATGGYSRKISFAGVEWKKAKGDPTDKPKGQEWIGDPEALSIYGRPNKDGTLRHRFGIFESSEQEDPAQLLLETWNALQEQKHPLDNYEMDVFLMEELTGYEHEKVRLGDITVAVDRSFAKPIEAEERVISFEYDVADPEHSGKVELGQFINLYDAELDNRVDKLERKINDRAGIWDNATKVIDAANGKNKNYYGPIEPVGEFIEGDLWFKVIDGEYTQTYRWNGEQWQLIVDIDVNTAKQEAAEASERAEDAFNRANEATENAQKAIVEAQESFDKAQEAFDKADAVNGIAADAVNVANTAKQSAINAINKASELESQVIDDFASVNSRADDLLAKINDNAASLKAAGGKITSIEQNVDDINGSLSSVITTLSDIDDVVSETQTSISMLDEKIEARATKTSVDALTGRISNAESSISTIAGQIELKANKEDVYTKTEADGRVTSAINSAKSEIKITTDGISQSVSSLSATVNGIEIGGRNYALGTSNSKTVAGKGGTNETATLYFVDFSKLAGKTITISFDFIATSSGGNARFRLQQATSPYMSITELNIYTKTNLTHYSHTMNLPSTSNEPRYINIRMDDFVGDITLSNLKLEIGNKETDWTQAIEDTDNAISDVQSYASSIDQKADSIQSSVSNLTKTVNSQGSRISNAETTINQHTTAINLKAEATNVYTKAQTDSALNNKVNLSTYNNKIGQIDVSINGISNRVSSTESNIKGLNGEINTVKSNIASLDIKADSIVSSVAGILSNSNNLIPDPSFENGAWDLPSNCSFVESDLHAGTKCLKVTKGNGYYKPKNLALKYPVSKGTILKLSWWVKMVSGTTYDTGNFKIRIARIDGSLISDLQLGGIFTSWTKRERTITLPSDVTGISITFPVSVNEGTVYVDDINVSDATNEIAIQTQFSTIEQTVNGITTRVGTSEGNISSLQQTASSFATRISNAEGNISSISQTLSGVQTTVSNKADKSTVTQLAGVVDSKISTTDANNKFATQSQLTQTSSSLTSKISSVQTNLDNLEIGGRNLVTGTSSEYRSVTGSGWGDYADPLTNSTSIPVVSGKTYSARIYLKTSTQKAQLRIRLYPSDNSTYNDVSGEYIEAGREGYSYVTFKVPSNRTRAFIMSARFGASDTPSNTLQWKELKLEVGDKCTAWTPAPEDQATVSQISQLSDAINLRVTKDDLMTQINLNPQGILIQGKNLILDGNTTVNGSFRVSNGNITSLDAGKITTGYLDAARISASSLSAISANLGNVTAGNIQGVNISSSTFTGDNMYIDGKIQVRQGRVEVKSKVKNDIGLYSYLDLDPAFAYIFHLYDGDIQTGRRIFMNPNEIRFWPSGGTTGDKLISINKNGINVFGKDVYVNGTGYGTLLAEASPLSAGGIRTNGEDFYIGVDGTNGGELRVTNLSGYNYGNGISYKPVRAADFLGGGSSNTLFQSPSSAILESRSNEVYARSNSELRVVKPNTWNTYVPVRASSFPTGSMAEYKQDIRPHTDSALAVINSATIYDYRLRTEVADGKDRLRTGLVIGEGYKTPPCVIDGDGVEQYMMNSLSWLAIQELDKKYKALEVENFALKRKVEELEKAVYAA
jgi:hypothetical protein